MIVVEPHRCAHPGVFNGKPIDAEGNHAGSDIRSNWASRLEDELTEFETIAGMTKYQENVKGTMSV